MAKTWDLETTHSCNKCPIDAYTTDYQKRYKQKPFEKISACCAICSISPKPNGRFHRSNLLNKVALDWQIAVRRLPRGAGCHRGNLLKETKPEIFLLAKLALETAMRRGELYVWMGGCWQKQKINNRSEEKPCTLHTHVSSFFIRVWTIDGKRGFLACPPAGLRIRLRLFCVVILRIK